MDFITPEQARFIIYAKVVILMMFATLYVWFELKTNQK